MELFIKALFIITQKATEEKRLLAFLSSFFEKAQIDCYAPIPLSECRMIKPYLLERDDIQTGTVIMIAVPYFSPSCRDSERNISAYAISKDYHLFFKQLFERLLLALRERYPQNKFAAYADHSPIDEIDAAARAGLGVIGRNHLLITPKYSSYVFLGELITDMELPCKSHPVAECENCGRCMSLCPAKECGCCLSVLTQKKGELTPKESESILKYGSFWGCDICQDACPHTQKALKIGSIETSIPFFRENTISCLSAETLERMSESDFSERAYSWRGRNTVLRNLKLAQSSVEKGEKSC